MNLNFSQWPFAAAVLCTFADYVGLATLQPSLPFYLEDLVAEDKVVYWNGLIVTAQFIAVVLGNIFWGFLGDRMTSRHVLMLAMLGDVITFCVTAFVRSPILLVVIRFLAGLSTPLTPALLYIFERASSPSESLRGVGQYVLAINFAYVTGGGMVSALYDVVGFLGLNLICGAIAAVALTYVTMCSAPSLVVGKKPTPVGVRYALTSPPFAAHAAIAFSSGFAFNANVLVSLWLLRDEFGWDARRAGVIFIGLAFLLVGMEKIVRCSVARVGNNFVITTGMGLQFVVLGLSAIPAVHTWLPALICNTVLICANLILQMLPNQSKPRSIADGYATNATSAVTSAGRVFFALGQGLSPILMAAAYEVHASAAYGVWCGVQLAQLLTIIASGQPLFHDQVPCAHEGSAAAKLKAASVSPAPPANVTSTSADESTTDEGSKGAP